MLHLLTVLGGREAVPSWVEVLGDRTVGGKKTLGMPGRFESLHAPLPLAGRLAEVLRTVIQRAALTVLHPRQPFLLRCALAFQLVSDEHPRYVRQSCHELPEERFGHFRVATTLHQHIEDVPVLVKGVRHDLWRALDREEDLIEMPRVARSGTLAPVAAHCSAF